MVGTNAKLSEFAAAVALAQWARWPTLQAGRSAQWSRYSVGLSDLRGVRLQSGFEVGALPSPVVLHLACDAGAVAAALERRGIETRRWYCPALHRHPAFAGCLVMGPQGGTVLPVTDHLERHTLGVPWHNLLQEEDMVLVVQALMVAMRERQR